MKAYSEKNGCYYSGERVIIIFVFLLRWDTEGFKKKNFYCHFISVGLPKIYDVKMQSFDLLHTVL